MYKELTSSDLISNCEVYNVESGVCSKCKMNYFLRYDFEENTCVQHCSDTETEILQTLSENPKSFTLNEIRVCQSRIEDCKRGTYLAQFNDMLEIDKQFVCLECHSGFYKVLRMHRTLNSIPFDVEDELALFHRNLQTPYFVCGLVDVPVDNCQFYLDPIGCIFNF
jgi:hypothetical protein